MNHRMHIPNSAFLLLATIALPQCSVYDTSERTERQPTITTAFDPLSGPKDTTAPEPFLDPLTLFSDQAYQVRPLAHDPEPMTSAVFAGGEEAMVNYIRTGVVAHLAPGIGWLERPIVHFTIDAQGLPENVQLMRSCGDRGLDTTLLDILSGMPAWKPATDAAGAKRTQVFELSFGAGGC